MFLIERLPKETEKVALTQSDGKSFFLYKLIFLT